MKVVVIGGTGHIGTYLSPRLVKAGHAVTCIARGGTIPYQAHEAWKQVAHVALDRAKEESNGTFAKRVASLQPEVVIDLIGYTPESTAQLVDGLHGRVRHFLHCGTIWVHGHSVQTPTTEDAPRDPFGDYGRRKAAIEKYLLEEARANRFPATVMHPGHLVGPGWNPINPAGNLNPTVFSNLATGREVALPHLGMETVHHVHVDDVAQAFETAVARPGVSIGESFHVVSAAALSLRGYAERMASWFGQDPNLRFLPWEEWRGCFSERDAKVTWDHIAHSPNCSIQKARTLLGYDPHFSSLEAVQESVSWLMAHGLVQRAIDEV